MANLKSPWATNASFYPVPSSDGSTDLLAVSETHTLAAGGASGDIIEAIPYPPNMTLVDAYVDTEDLGTTWTADVGIMSGKWGDSGARTCGAELMTGKAFGTTGVYRADVPGFSRIAPSTDTRSIGVKGTTIGTPTTGAKFTVTAIFRPMVNGV